MKKILVLLAIICYGCDEQEKAPPIQLNYTMVGNINRCTHVIKFNNDNNVCYIVDYCGSGGPSISCVKNEVALTK